MPTEKIFKTLKLLNVNDILKLQKLKLYYKYKNKKLPHYLQNLHFKDVAYFMQQEHNI